MIALAVDRLKLGLDLRGGGGGGREREKEREGLKEEMSRGKAGERIKEILVRE